MTIGCPENDTALNSLNLTLGTAQGAGVDPGNPILQAAQAYYNQASGPITGDWFDFGSSCQSAVAQAQQQISNVNALILAANPNATVINPSQLPQPSSSSFFPSIPSWVLPVGAGILGLGLVAYLFGPLIRGMSKKGGKAVAQ